MAGGQFLYVIIAGYNIIIRLCRILLVEIVFHSCQLCIFKSRFKVDISLSYRHNSIGSKVKLLHMEQRESSREAVLKEGIL